MNAIEMLEKDHKEVSKLFSKFEKARGAAAKQDLVNQIGDALAIHATIEERHFYPAVREKRTEDILLESLEEHLAIKRVIADLLRMSPDDESYDAKVTVLKEEVEHHVEEEEKDLFPKVKKIFDAEALDDLAEQMLETRTDLEDEDAPRMAVLSETAAAPPLS